MQTPTDYSSNFLASLATEQGGRKQVWRNNNGTLRQEAYVIDMDDLRAAPSEIFQRLYAHNRENQEGALVAVPVAGWDAEEDSGCFSCLPCFSRQAREERLTTEYAQSFSLSNTTTAENADLILRASKAAQSMNVFTLNGERYFRVSAGVRITDADRYLFKKGLALPPNMPTLHVASLVGAAANGSYGPGKDYGPLSTNIVEMKVINARGEPLTLSATENPKLFSVLRDCHMGAACYVSEITLKNIEPKFLMRRRNSLYKDIDELKQKMQSENRLEDEHFLAMYIPIDISEKGSHAPRIRVTTFERVTDRKAKPTGCQEYKNLSDYLNLMTTEAGEPLINLIVESEDLHKYFPFVLKTAALKTYGQEAETVEVDWSASIAHIFGTYTDLPITDINWLIQVDSADQARDLLTTLLEMTEAKLKEYAEDEQYPLFNAFARYLKGVHYPKGEGGITPTVIDHEHQSILSFEYLTYGALSQTPAFQSLVDDVVQHLKSEGFKFTYHPGKDMPRGIRSLTQIFTDTVGKARLERFQEAVYELHGGEENIPYSTLLTPQKKTFIGLDPVRENEVCSAHHECSEKQKREALKAILELAESEHNHEICECAKEQLDC